VSDHEQLPKRVHAKSRVHLGYQFSAPLDISSITQFSHAAQSAGENLASFASAQYQNHTYIAY